MAAASGPARTEGLRTMVVVLATVGLLAVVAGGLGATSPVPHRPDHAAQRSVLTFAATLAALALAGVVAMLAYAFWPSADPADPPTGSAPAEHIHHWRFRPQWRWWQDALAVVGVVVAASLFLMLVALVVPHTRPGFVPAPRGHAPGGGHEPVAARPAPTNWLAVGAAGIAAALGGAVAVRRLRRPRPRTRPRLGDPSDRAVALAALDASIDRLLAEPDDRRAVIAAYARMEEWLGQVGRGRAPWETPTEYLDRLLVQVGAPPDDVTELTDLFGQARFSQHPIGPEMKRRAVDALVGVRAAVVPAP